MPYKSVLLIGGSGNLGSLILNHLQASPSNFTVSVLSRQSSKHQYPSNIKNITVDDDYPTAQLTEAFKDQDVVISAISMTGMHHQHKFIDACVAAGVKRYIPTEFGLDDLPDWLLNLRPMFKTKHDIRDYLAEQESKGLTWTSICCNVFFAEGIENGFFQFDWNTKRAVLLDGGETKWPGTTLDTVAVAVVRVLEKQDKTANQILLIRDFDVSQKEVMDEIEKQAGGWQVERPDFEPWLEEAKERVRQGHNEELMKLTFAVAQSAGDWSKKDNFANELLGLPTKSFSEEVGHALKRIQEKRQAS